MYTLQAMLCSIKIGVFSTILGYETLFRTSLWHMTSNSCYSKLLQIIQNLHNASFTMNWYIICGYSSLFCPAKINILCWFSFVFYCFVTCLTGYISVCNLATLRSFCGSRSQIYMCHIYVQKKFWVEILTKRLLTKITPNLTYTHKDYFFFLLHFICYTCIVDWLVLVYCYIYM